MAYNNSRNPLRALQKRIGQEIVVRLKDGTRYVGNLKEYDNFMNIIVTNAVEFTNNEESGKFEELFVRGNNVLFIEPEAN
ncbi:Putative snRNP Sm-like protein [Candidatus Lokiarchaeum ossiferum]|uniref:SnRNP Sm-like protein n=1 Tax=Candidatus Lokiarchaeum ossiferum TaxID=2951803 RepID=A0ABY6HQJ3_9ARCH|nr:Putative snRNP Sm-like protein [Candidatus Lokiarchaeum sp. B-35]